MQIRHYIPTEKQLTEKVKVVSVKVEGEFIARIDEKRKTSKPYSVEVLVPEKFNKADLKRATPKELHKQFTGEFVSMRTFEQAAPAKKTDKTVVRKDFYSKRELERFAKQRTEILRSQKSEIDTRRKLGDTSEYDPITGLPPVINDGIGVEE